MVQTMVKYIKRCRDSADTYTLGARMMSRNSDLYAQMCRVCPEACDRCAEECEKHNHDHYQRCAQVCRCCADSCHQMAA